jgi:hypothetical protein
MKEVQIVESLKYGGRTFLYFIVSVILGGGGIALGLAVGYNAVTIFGTGGDPVIYDTPELIAGVVLVILGGTVLFTGLFGLVYKLLADAVAAGYKNTGPSGLGREPPTEGGEAVTSTAPASPTDHSETARNRQPGPGRATSPAQTTPATGGARTRATDESGHQESPVSAGEHAGNGDSGDEPGHSTESTESEKQTAVHQPEAEEEASSGEATAIQTDQERGSEPPTEQDREQTASEIAFGETDATDKAEQPIASDEPPQSAESEPDDESPEESGDDTVVRD